MTEEEIKEEKSVVATEETAEKTESEEAKTEEAKTEEAKAEKKGGKVSGFFKNLGKKLDDATYDMRLTNNFRDNHAKYTVYCGTSAFMATPEVSVEEHLDEGYIVALDEGQEIKPDYLIAKNNCGDVLHIAAVEEAELEITFEEKENKKKALKITLGVKAQKVEVIKVGNDFYLK